MVAVYLKVFFSSRIRVKLQAFARQLVVVFQNHTILGLCEMMMVSDQPVVDFLFRLEMISDLVLKTLSRRGITLQFPSRRLMLFLLICQSTILALSQCVLAQLLKSILSNCLYSFIDITIIKIVCMELVEGLIYLPQFISKQTEIELQAEINSGKWSTSLKRRTQHYGYRYSYDKSNTLQQELPIPPTFQPLKQSIQACILEHTGRLFTFDQLIINQYEPGQGISAHIDNKVLFEGIIVGLSISSNATMVFQRGQHKHKLLLERRSLLIMSGEARSNWKHSIPSRKKDDGVSRGVRLSLTWRQVKQDYKKK